uniref:Uncharacterized protein n=1 Tax=Aegilops tauschii subsp. strangulata TaxID=200361 RepID=A0A453IGD5_AEGTS
ETDPSCGRGRQTNEALLARPRRERLSGEAAHRRVR